MTSGLFSSHGQPRSCCMKCIQIPKGANLILPGPSSPICVSPVGGREVESAMYDEGKAKMYGCTAVMFVEMQ